jgi:ABC-type Fe3+ transport system substrate-binding protein
MQVQSATDPPKKLALGERAVMADGGEYVLLQLKEAGRPVEPVYATEGTPLIVGPNGIFKQAPNPNAARLFQSFCFTPEAQQLIIDHGGMRSEHLQTKEKPGRKPFREIKVMKEDAVSVEIAACSPDKQRAEGSDPQSVPFDDVRNRRLPGQMSHGLGFDALGPSVRLLVSQDWYYTR